MIALKEGMAMSAMRLFTTQRKSEVRRIVLNRSIVREVEFCHLVLMARACMHRKVD